MNISNEKMNISNDDFEKLNKECGYNNNINEYEEYKKLFKDRQSCNYNVYCKKAESRNLKFELTKEEFDNIRKKICYICGKKPSIFHRNGIDRIDSALGYTVDNCNACCGDCNFMKSNFDYDDFFEKIIKINNLHGNNIKASYSSIVKINNNLKDIQQTIIKNNNLNKTHNSFNNTNINKNIEKIIINIEKLEKYKIKNINDNEKINRYNLYLKRDYDDMYNILINNNVINNIEQKKLLFNIVNKVCNIKTQLRIQNNKNNNDTKVIETLKNKLNMIYNCDANILLKILYPTKKRKRNIKANKKNKLK